MARRARSSPPAAKSDGADGAANALEARLRTGWLNFARTEEAIARYLLAKPDDIPFETGATIAAGARVTWTWNAAGSHSIRSTGLPPEIFRNSIVMSAAGSTYSVRIFNPGTYDYDCAVHGAAMTGRIVVK